MTRGSSGNNKAFFKNPFKRHYPNVIPALNSQPEVTSSSIPVGTNISSGFSMGISHGMMGPNARLLFHGGNPTFQQHVEVHQTEGSSIGTLYLNSSPAAAFNAKDRYDPPKCHPNTRSGLLNMSRNWFNSKRSRIMWLHGSAGAGKSAIAQTVSEELRAASKLAASFFFSRTASAESHRGHEGRFVTTIAYQLSETIPGLRGYIEQVVVNRPSVFDLTLSEQTTALIIEPLKQLARDNTNGNLSADFPRIIVVDGLDECNDEAGQKQVLEVVAMLVGDWDILPFSVFLSSRPELVIQSWFDSSQHKDGDLAQSVSLLDHCDSEYDIKLFVTAEVTDIRQSHLFKDKLPPGWPSKVLIESIVNRACGQFIYASTVLKYIRDPRHYPHLRLEYILNNTIPESDHPYAELDALYLHIMRSTRYPVHVHRVLAFRVVSVLFIGNASQKHFLTFLSSLLSLPCPVETLLVDLRSVMDIDTHSINFQRPHKPQQHKSTVNMTPLPISFHHASLLEFLLDRRRAGEFHVDIQKLDEEFFEMALAQISACSPATQVREHCSYLAMYFVFILQTQTVRRPSQGLRMSVELMKWHDSLSNFVMFILEHLQPKLVALDGMEFLGSLGSPFLKPCMLALQRKITTIQLDLASASLPSEIWILFFDSFEFGFELPPTKKLPQFLSINTLITWYIHSSCNSAGGDMWGFLSNNVYLQRLKKLPVFGSNSLLRYDWGLLKGPNDEGECNQFSVDASKAVVFYLQHVSSLFDSSADAAKAQDIRDALDHLCRTNGENWRVKTVLQLLAKIQLFLWLHCVITGDVVKALEHLSERIFPPNAFLDLEESVSLMFPDLASDDVLNNAFSRDSHALRLPRWFFQPLCPGISSGFAENLGLLHDYVRLYYTYREACDSDSGFAIEDANTRPACNIVYELLDPDDDLEDWSFWHRTNGIINAD